MAADEDWTQVLQRHGVLNTDDQVAALVAALKDYSVTVSSGVR